MYKLNYIYIIYIYIYIYIHTYICVCAKVIIKPMCPPSHHHNGSVVTHGFGHMMYG